MLVTERTVNSRPTTVVHARGANTRSGKTGSTKIVGGKGSAGNGADTPRTNARITRTLNTGTGHAFSFNYIGLRGLNFQPLKI